MGMPSDTVSASFASENIAYVSELFRGECSKIEVARLQAIAEENTCDIIVGIGGGKTLDTAKAIAYHMKNQLSSYRQLRQQTHHARHALFFTPKKVSLMSTSSFQPTLPLSLLKAF